MRMYNNCIVFEHVLSRVHCTTVKGAASVDGFVVQLRLRFKLHLRVGTELATTVSGFSLLSLWEPHVVCEGYDALPHRSAVHQR